MREQERSQPAREYDSAYRTPEVKASARLFDGHAAAAFLSYLAISVLVFGRGALAHPATVYVGQTADPALYVWFLSWWSHAISHGVNPFITTAVWAPTGASLGWANDFALAACLFSPITHLWGPIVSYNLLHLIGPPLSGWSAFVLCRYLAGRFWPAWMGGLVFAFSPYMLTGMADEIFLLLVFPLPLAVRATLRRLKGDLAARDFVAILAVLLSVQFLVSQELFATATLFGAIAFWLAARSSSPDEYIRLRSTAWLIGGAYVISVLIISPYLYFMFAYERPTGFIFVPWGSSVDLLGLVVPTRLNQLGNLPLLQAITHRFRANLYDCGGGYIGLPLLAIIVLFAREHWRDRSCRLMLWMFGAACILAMGPLLEILGYRLLPLPGAALSALPLISKALPGRLMLYAYLVLAVIVTMWLAEEDGRNTLRWALGLAIVPFMLPNLSASYWATPAEIPAFFASGLYRQNLSPGETVMVLPYGYLGEGMLWQATTDMYYRMAGGYLSAAPPVPREDRSWPIVAGLFKDSGVPEAGDQLKAYMASHNVSAVIVGPRSFYLISRIADQPTIATLLRWPTIDRERIATQKLLASLDTQPLDIGGITLYRVGPQTLAPYRQLTALDMQRRAARARFEALLLGAERYLAQGGNPASLSPKRAQELGLLPQDWFGGTPFSPTDAFFHCRVILGPSKPAGMGIEVGVEGSYDALKPIVEAYGTDATRTDLPNPQPLSPSAAPREPAMMVMTFDRAGLERAAAAAAQRRKADLHPTISTRAAG